MSHNYPYRVPPPDGGANGRRGRGRPSGNGPYAPPPCSSSAAPQENVLSLLSSCGLEPGDLARLAELPEDVLTVESLPHILQQMKGKKGVVKPPAPAAAAPPSSSSSSSHTGRPAINWEQLRSQPVQYPLISSTRRPPEPGQGHWGPPRTSSSLRADPPLPPSSSSGYTVDRGPGPPMYGKTEPVPAFSPAGRLAPSHFCDSGPADRQAPQRHPTTPPLPQHHANKYGGRHQKPGPSSGRSSRPPSSARPSAPSMKQGQDFHGTTPSVFPYACSLCDITVLSEKVWTQHVNSKLHADGQLSLLQEFPKWDCRVNTVRRDDGQSQSRETKGNPAPAAGAANHSRAATPSNKNSQKKAKGKVVCVKFPPQTVDETYLRKLTEPFGKIVKVLMFPSLAFVELGSVDQANDLVKFHVNYPPTVNGSQIDFSISSTFSFLQSSQVVSFTPAPAGEDGRSDLISIVKRFGEPLYTLFLPSNAFVEMKTVAEAQKLVDYYSSNVLRLGDGAVRVSFSGEYKSLARIASAKRYEEPPAPRPTKRARTRSRSRSRSRGKRTRTRSRSRDKEARTRSKSREKRENRTRSRSRDKSSRESRTRTRSRSTDKSSRESRTRTRSRSRDKSNTGSRTRTRSRSRDKSSRESRTRTRSRSRDKSNTGSRTRTRSRSIDKSNTGSRTRTRSRSRDKSNTGSRTRTRSRSIDKSNTGSRTRTRSRSRDKSSREKLTRSRSRSGSQDKTSSPPTTETRSGSRETSEEPKKPEEPAPAQRPEPEAAGAALLNEEDDDDEDEDDEGFSVDDSDIEGMEVIAEDGQEVEDEDAEEEEEEEEEHSAAVKTSEHGEEEEEEEEEVKKEEEVKGEDLKQKEEQIKGEEEEDLKKEEAKEEDLKQKEEDVKQKEEAMKKKKKEKKTEEEEKEEEVKTDEQKEEEAKEGEKEDAQEESEEEEDLKKEEAKEEEDLRQKEVKNKEEAMKKKKEEKKTEEEEVKKDEQKEEEKEDAQEESEEEEDLKKKEEDVKQKEEVMKNKKEEKKTEEEEKEESEEEEEEEGAAERQEEEDEDFPVDPDSFITLDECGESGEEAAVVHQSEAESSRVVYVRNLPPRFYSDADFLDALRDCGTAVRYLLIRSRREGFVEMSTPSEAAAAARELNSRPVVLNKSKLDFVVSRKYYRLTCGWEVTPEPDGRSGRRRRRRRRSPGEEEEEEEEEEAASRGNPKETQQRTGGHRETPRKTEAEAPPRGESTKTPEEEPQGGGGGGGGGGAEPRSQEEERPDGGEDDGTPPDGSMKDGEGKSTGAEEDEVADRKPARPVGVEFVRPVVGYFCNLCQLIYADEDEAKEEHCRTPQHYRRYQEKTGKDPWTS